MPLSSIGGERKRAAGKTLILEPWVFADEWAGKPRDKVCVGLRLMSEAEKMVARQQAEELALELHPRGGSNAIDAFNDALLRNLCAYGICDPNDVTMPWGGMEFAEDAVRIALTSRGARFIYEAIDRYEIESSPLVREISDEDLDQLSGYLDGEWIARLGLVRASAIRKMLGYALDELRAAATIS